MTRVVAWTLAGEREGTCCRQLRMKRTDVVNRIVTCSEKWRRLTFDELGVVVEEDGREEGRDECCREEDVGHHDLDEVLAMIVSDKKNVLYRLFADVDRGEEEEDGLDEEQ